jgi:UDP-glucose 4-epimerase
MIVNIIVGKESNLSNAIIKKIKNGILISSREIQEDIDILSKYRNCQINLIFNNFQAAQHLKILNSSSDYIINSILVTARIMDYLQKGNINKIIYTSSSSVYGNNIFCNEKDELKPMNLHSALKVANEKLIEKFCTENNIDYTITRIFNLYGGTDKFSIISKMINAYKNNEILTIVNNGNGIRDFIHIDDVVDIYVKLLDIKNLNIINIGTGFGSSIKNILDFLSTHNVSISTTNTDMDELKTSTSDRRLLDKIFHKKSFIKLEDHLKKEFNI